MKMGGPRTPYFILLFLFLADYIKETIPAPQLGVQNLIHSTDLLAEEVNYLYKNGYLNQGERESSLSNNDPTIIKGAVKNFQQFFHIPSTGDIDLTTRTIMHVPRCGYPDVGVPLHSNNQSGSGRVKRYNILGEQYVWDMKVVTYSVLNYPRKSDFKHWEVHKIIRNAFRVWGNVIPLDFEEVKGEGAEDAVIRIRFERRRHSNDEEHPRFDGPGGDLAHAFSPKTGWGQMDGDIHFDDDENFTLNTDGGGYNLFQIAVHEIGHALGLRHSDNQNAIMWPTYRLIPSFKQRLPYDDLLGIQKLYGVRMRTHPESKNVGQKSHCALHYPTVFSIGGEVYALRGPRFWKSNGEVLISPNGGSIISAHWYDLPSHTRAAYYRYDGVTVFFKGSKYWVYHGSYRVVGYPKKVATLGLPTRIDAVLSFGEKTYFFKKTKVWRYNEILRKVEDGWPKKVSSVFKGFPTRITAGFHHNDGHSYIFDGKKYYRLNDWSRRVDAGYPRFFTIDFMGCSSITS